MGDQYICVGPYVEMKARAEVEEEDFPLHHPLGKKGYLLPSYREKKIYFIYN